MPASDASLYEELILESNDRSRSVDIKLGTISIDYYEDIFSPTITAKIRVVNTCLLYTSPSPRDTDKSRMPSSA